MEEYKENNTEFNVVGFTGVYNVTLVIMNGRNVRSFGLSLNWERQ